MFSRIEFILTETFISLRRHPLMAFAAISCVCATLFIAGLVYLAVLNANFAVDSAMKRVSFNVYFHPNPKTMRVEAEAAYQRIRKLPDVRSAVFVPRENAWAKLRKEDPSLYKLMDGKNPYPDAVIVKAKDVRDIARLQQELDTWPEVASVKSAPRLSTFLETTRRAIGQVGMILGVILLFLSLVIIHHTIELTLYARRKEIHIMSLVGATPITVALPFLLEGVVYGIFGGGLAFGLLTLLYHFSSTAMRVKFDTHLFQDAALLPNGMEGLLLAGITLGLIGSTASVVKYLRRPRNRITNA